MKISIISDDGELIDKINTKGYDLTKSFARSVLCNEIIEIINTSKKLGFEGNNMEKIEAEFKKNIINFLFDKYMKYVEYRFNNWSWYPDLSRINIIWNKDTKYRIQARNTGFYIGEISLSKNSICYCIEEEYQNLFERALE